MIRLGVGFLNGNRRPRKRPIYLETMEKTKRYKRDVY